MIDLTGDLRIIRLHCRCGGIGRRSGFKIRRLYGCASSSLATGTKFKGLVFIARPFFYACYLDAYRHWLTPA